MTAEWQVTVYGKPLDPQTGSPPQGAGYGRLGMSVDFPPGLFNECLPERVGLGDHSGWEKSVLERGPAQFILRPVRISTAGQWFLQAAQAFIVPGHPTGEKRKSLFIAFAVAPVADVDDRTLFSLHQGLARMRAGDPVYPIRPANWAETFHGEWFDEDVRNMLAAVVAGHAVNVVEPDGSGADRFARKAMLCLACLPAAVRWRVPVGWQSNKIPEWCALGHGESGLAPMRRYKGGAWRIENLDLTAGWEAVRAIEDRVRGARSVDAIFRAADDFWGADLAGRFPKIIPQDADWKTAVGVLREAGSVTKLREYLKSGSGLRLRVNDFVAMRPAVLAEVLDAVARKPPTRSNSFPTVDRHPDRDDDQPITAPISLEPVFQPAARSYPLSPRPLLPPPVVPTPTDPVALAFDDVCGVEWKSAWEDLATGRTDQAVLASTLGRLLGLLPFDARWIQPDNTRLIPYREQWAVTNRLAAEWRQATRWEDWAELIATAGRSSPPPVLRAWFDAAGHELAWRVVDLELRDPPVRCAPEAPSDPALRAAVDLLRDSSPGKDSLKALEDALAPATADAAFRLADRLFRRGRVAEALILEHAAGRTRPGTGSTDRLAPDLVLQARSQERTEWARAVSEGIGRYGWRSALIRAALVLWGDTPRDLRRSEIADRLSQVEAEILLGEPSRLAARVDDDLSKLVREVASALLPQLLKGSSTYRDRVVRALGRASAYADRSQLLPLLGGLDGGPGSPLRDIPAFQLAADLRAGLIGTVAKLPKQLSAGDALLTLDVLGLKSSWRGQRITGGPVDTTDLARAAAVAVGPLLYDHWEPLLFSKLLPALLRAALADETDRQFWDRVLTAANVADRPGVRLLAGGRVARITPKEEELLKKLDDTLFVTAVERFDVITAHVLGRLMDLLGTKGLEFDLGFLERLGAAACQRKQALVADALIRHLIGRLDAPARGECARAWDAAAGGWTRARSRATSRDRVSQLLLNQLFDWHTVHADTAAEWVYVLRSRTDEPPAAAVTFSIPPPDSAGLSLPRT